MFGLNTLDTPKQGEAVFVFDGRKGGEEEEGGGFTEAARRLHFRSNSGGMRRASEDAERRGRRARVVLQKRGAPLHEVALD